MMQLTVHAPGVATGPSIYSNEADDTRNSSQKIT